VALTSATGGSRMESLSLFARRATPGNRSGLIPRPVPRWRRERKAPPTMELP